MRSGGVHQLLLRCVVVAWLISFLGVRVGEASNPGPRPRKPIDRTVPLVQDLADRTQKHYEDGERLLNRFLDSRGMTADELADLPPRALGTQMSEFVKWAWDDEEITRNVVESAIGSFGYRVFWTSASSPKSPRRSAASRKVLQTSPFTVFKSA